ncbi:MAG: hypothetical protein IPK04_14570 [Bdellovibrionales bacterium]|jgi:hypothetical protein|nr:hypothetical protein [Bdellovibrionales bacterium]
MQPNKLWGRYFRRVLLSLGFLFLLVSYNNCAKESQSSSPGGGGVTSANSVTGLSAVNYFKSPVPSSMVGENGYTFLMKEYFGPQCAACHAGGVIFPDFADKGHPHDSYLAAKYYFQNEDMIHRITDNPYCRPGCTLDPRGEVYKAIMTWLDQR